MEEEREEETTKSLSLSEAEMSGASGDIPDDQDGDEDNEAGGVSPQESMRQDSLILREEGLIAQMEREAEEAGLGGGSMGIRRTSRRAGVVPTPMRRPVRIECRQLS